MLEKLDLNIFIFSQISSLNFLIQILFLIQNCLSLFSHFCASAKVWKYFWYFQV